jgi:cytidylate kinase
MVIAIDGPAGSGKTTIGRMLARSLGYSLVDTGLFYRAVTVEARRRQVALDDVESLTGMIKAMQLMVNTSPGSGGGPLVTVDGRDISAEAQDTAIADDLSRVSQVPEVRQLLIDPQRRAAQGNAVVLGRDIGTVIFPDAQLKFFFTAPAAERVARRRRQLDRVQGTATPDAVMRREIEARDKADEEREIAPLRRAADAIIVATEGKSVQQVFDEVMDRLPKH